LDAARAEIDAPRPYEACDSRTAPPALHLVQSGCDELCRDGFDGLEQLDREELDPD
jgi:hypothetical protein